ncbi:MAG: hypothetical protein SGJ17_10195 [Hyphomicrobiales bacterium]|nr:hypothetical protein [Hyphomicrobiales bacterium]
MKDRELPASSSTVINGFHTPPPLAPDVARLDAISAALVSAAMLSAWSEPETDDALTNRLRIIYDDEQTASSALQAAYAHQYLERTAEDALLTPDGAAALELRLGARKVSGEAEALKALAGLTLGVKPTDRKKMAALSRSGAMESAAIAKLYGFGLGDTPSRSAVRFALAQHLLIGQFPYYASHLAKASARDARPNTLITALIMGHIGGSHTSLMEAETHMLSNALGAKTRTKTELAAALICAASAPQLRSQRESTRIPAKQTGVEDFANTVRRIAKAMETKPYAGRVAIAQVYDAGVAQDLAFGALDEFKKRVADACRAGYLDLERYDIAGPLDASLRERSRTPFGRDERHFIVNQWI